MAKTARKAKQAPTEAPPSDLRGMQGLNVTYRAVADLIPYTKNARTHSDAQNDVICKSIKEFGFTNPLLVDSKSGVIAGHGRLMAARKLGMTEVPCIELAHMSDVQRRAYVLADNQTALLAGWDDDLLVSELGDLAMADLDLDALGFDRKELDELLKVKPPKTEREPPTPRKPKKVVASDEFTMSIRGKREHQSAILATLQATLRPFEGVTIELGIMAIEGGK